MQFELTQHTIEIDCENTDRIDGGIIVHSPSVKVKIPFQATHFYRHGWQSWSLAAWLDPATPSVPIRSPEFRTKDEDPLHALDEAHINAWVSALETPEGKVILLGSLGLCGRVETGSDHMLGCHENESGEWFLGGGEETEVFSRYAALLGERLGKGRVRQAPRVWCSWYSLYRRIHENILLKVLEGLGDLPFDVFQLDDGWQVSTGDWEPNKKFPSGMDALAEKIRGRGKRPGLWLSPLIVTADSSIWRDHQEWVLKDDNGVPVFTGRNWSGKTYALDASHPAVLEWLDGVLRKVRGWGYDYLKLDFLYAAGFPGRHKRELPREQIYRQAMEVMRTAAGEAYLLACGALILPSLGLCDGLRVGPDVTPFWVNTPMSAWLNNPNHPSTQNAIRTSLHRLWLQPLVHTDPDVVFFRSRHNKLKKEQMTLLQDLALLCNFKASSDLPQWLSRDERDQLGAFLNSTPRIERTGRTRFRIDGREVDAEPFLELPKPARVPAGLATTLGLVDMLQEVIPALLATLGKAPR